MRCPARLVSRKFFAACFGAALLAWFLAAVFSGKLVLPQSLDLGPLHIRYYGLIMAAAILAGLALARRTAWRQNFSPQDAEDAALYLVPAAFLGARIYHVASSLDYYLAHPGAVFQVWQGGLSIYGAILGGLAGLCFYQVFGKRRINLLAALDWLAPALLLGQIVGRFGNLFNYEAYGYPTGLPWKMFVPGEFRPQGYLNSQFFHPWFAYEALANLAILRVLARGRNSLPPGSLFLSYVLLYNIVRFCLEFLRIDSSYVGPFRLNAITSLALAILASAGLLFLRKKHNA